jgi:hypothetical protein
MRVHSAAGLININKCFYYCFSGDIQMKQLSILLFFASILAGCGGGSSSPAPFTPLAKVTITADNSTTVTNAAINAATQDFGNEYTKLIPSPGSTALPAPPPTATPASTENRLLYRVTDFALNKVAENKNVPLSVTGATFENACVTGNPDSGTYTITTNDTIPATAVTLTFSNCDFGNGSKINGSFALSGISEATSTFSATLSINLTVTATGAPTRKLVGGYTLSATGVGLAGRIDTLQGSSFVASVDALNEALTDFSFTSAYDDTTPSPSTYTEAANYTVSSDFTGGSFTVKTTVPIVKNVTDAYPVSGQIVVYGANSTALRITILASSGSNLAGTSTGQVKREISTNTTTTTPGTWTEITPLATWGDL